MSWTGKISGIINPSEVLTLSVSSISKIGKSDIFVPTDLSNLITWLAADKITGLNDNDTIQTWNDSSGNSNNASQSNINARPVYKTNIYNGKPTIRFNGSNQFLTLTSGWPTSENATVFVVAKLTHTCSDSPVDQMRGILVRYWLNGGFNLSGWYTGGKNIIRCGHYCSSTYFFNGSSELLNNNLIFTLYSSGQNREIYLNGNLEASNSSVVASNYDQTPGFIGAVPNEQNSSTNVVRFWYGDISEIIIYNDSKNLADRTEVENYLKLKWGF